MLHTQQAIPVSAWQLTDMVQVYMSARLHSFHLHHTHHSQHPPAKTGMCGMLQVRQAATIHPSPQASSHDTTWMHTEWAAEPV
jgi:hypothetical protein